MAHIERGRRLLPFLLLVSLLGALAVACEDEDPSVTNTAPPSTPEEFFERLEQALTREGRVWHGTEMISQLERGQSLGWGELETWLDLANERGRYHFKKDPDNSADIGDEFVQLVVEDRIFTAAPGSDDPVSAYSVDEVHSCLPELNHYFVARFLCGVTDLEGVQLSVLSNVEFEGHHSTALLATRPIPSQSDPERPPGAPTPDPIIAAATRWELTLYVDAATFLPLAVIGVLDSDSEGKAYQTRSDISGEFVDANSVDDLFDPDVLGYVTPEEEERRVLEHPALGVPVYWLGRELNRGDGLPQLRLGRVVDAHPERPKPEGGEPNVRLSLGYRGSGGRVSLDLWQPGEWEKFKARLGGKFAWSWCSETVEKQIGDARLVILLGHEPPPHELGEVTAVPITPGAEPPTPVPYTPTIPPLRTDPCPSKPYDRFMAEMHYPDVTVVINGTLFYGGQEGELFGAFDDPDALEAVARALKLRQPGE